MHFKIFDLDQLVLVTIHSEMDVCGIGLSEFNIHV